MFKKDSINTLFYSFVAVNILPLFGVLFSLWDFKNVLYLYWGESTMVGLIALAMFAKYLIVFFLLSGALGFIVYMANPDLMAYLTPALIFWCLYSLCWLVYVEIGKNAYGQKIRKLKPIEQLAVYIGYMGCAIIFCILLAKGVYGGWPPFWDTLPFYKSFIGIAVIVPSISIGLIRIIDMIGAKHFIDFITGKYHRPQEQDGIVLFLDMVNSSGMAEKLESKQSMKLIAQFIYDCSYIFRINGGDILNYTGDGLVVLWPRTAANSALSAVNALKDHFESRPVKSDYWKKYGITPEFRIGLHAGNIVISQIGEEKLFLGLYGDVVNTASRLEQLNKTLGTQILLSSDVIRGLNQSWKALLKPLGEKEIRGRDEKVSVYTLYAQ